MNKSSNVAEGRRADFKLGRDLEVRRMECLAGGERGGETDGVGEGTLARALPLARGVRRAPDASRSSKADEESASSEGEFPGKEGDPKVPTVKLAIILALAARNSLSSAMSSLLGIGVCSGSQN